MRPLRPFWDYFREGAYCPDYTVFEEGVKNFGAGSLRIKKGIEGLGVSKIKKKNPGVGVQF